jgi:hypothetical protein
LILDFDGVRNLNYKFRCSQKRTFLRAHGRERANVSQTQTAQHNGRAPTASARLHHRARRKTSALTGHRTPAVYTTPFNAASDDRRVQAAGSTAKCSRISGRLSCCSATLRWPQHGERRRHLALKRQAGRSLVQSMALNSQHARTLVRAEQVV